jgi:hypothetical protein
MLELTATHDLTATAACPCGHVFDTKPIDGSRVTDLFEYLETLHDTYPDGLTCPSCGEQSTLVGEPLLHWTAP